jgi:hypothetical protein
MKRIRCMEKIASYKITEFILLRKNDSLNLVLSLYYLAEVRFLYSLCKK